MTLTGLSCLLAAVTISLVTRLFEAVVGWPLGFDALLGVLALQLVGMLGIPVGLGMGIRDRWPRVADEQRGAIQGAAFGVLALLIIVVISTELDAFVGGLTHLVLLSAALVALSELPLMLVAIALFRAERVSSKLA